MRTRPRIRTDSAGACAACGSCRGTRARIRAHASPRVAAGAGSILLDRDAQAASANQVDTGVDADADRCRDRAWIRCRGGLDDEPDRKLNAAISAQSAMQIARFMPQITT